MTLTVGDLLGGLFLFDHFDIVFLSKIFQGFDIGHILMLHHEAHCGAGFSAAEALVYTFGWRYGKRRGLLVMEGTAGLII